MGPETLALLIPILALSIPIVAIISNMITKKYKYGAGPEQLEQNKHQQAVIAKLEERVAELEKTVSLVHDSVDQIEQDQRFISKLLEDKQS